MVDDRELIDEIIEMTTAGYLWPIDVSPRPVPDEQHTEVRAKIRLNGGWHGSVALSCSAHFARCAAGRMFGVEPDELNEEQMEDALGELVNVVGGNIKAVLEEQCTLSLPVVTWGDDEPDSEEVCVSKAAYSSGVDGEPIIVTLLRDEDNEKTTGSVK